MNSARLLNSYSVHCRLFLTPSYKDPKVTRWASLYLLATEKEETHGNLPKVKMAELGYFLRFEDYIYLAKSVYRNNSQILRGITPRRRG